ncbi:crotonase/enoyl-CoA hydratase family protein [Nocardioides bruguierae]|uniref:Crotonase/enoyl-CoA hydratase family protein n=1 Tax=Nocardioides bruguierae TaxID=2945102 RepID=A0A9X2D8I9_9ACTN|nr:crotonase/enoyl-CoA hydratase family protein [Nocardioides bruguierae]MCM0621125.1 crotonase/enoyl-CoA hydratase family protein [Nocardioides bruguierae]
MDFETLRWELDEDGILLLTLHRPEQLNAFDLTMARELLEAFRAVKADDAVRAVVVTGEGRAFCAGMDLTGEGNVFGLDETLSPTAADLREHLTEEPWESGVRDTGGKLTLAIHDCDKPVVAAINGAAVGIGATMTLAMDVRMAGSRARIGFVFGRLGIVPEAASSYFLPRLIGLPRALELVYSADVVDADHALEVGLVRSVHEPEDLVPAAVALARSFVVGRSAAAVAMTRRLMNAGAGATHPLEAHRRDSLAMWLASVGDGKEGVAAFLDKRDPTFTGRATDVPDLG